MSEVRVRAALVTLVLSMAAAALVSCTKSDRPLAPRSQTWAELRTVRRAVEVTPPGEAERAPYPRERLVDGEAIHVGQSGLAWLRRDGGATLLVQGPAELKLLRDAIEVNQGRVFVDTPPGVTTELVTPNGPLHLAHVRASIDVGSAEDHQSSTEAYVLAGEVRTDSAARAGAGERLRIEGKSGAQAKATPALTWEDWTGGLATTDRAAEPAPFGLGTVGARRPGDAGAPRFPLAIQKLDVRVSIDHDFALTEVDETFFNPSSEVVEGVYRFRTPDGATLHRFGVDREGVVVWGRVKEKAAAAAQYQSNVYQGSTEDPALLEWDAPGVYRARLYPIGPGQSRRVVVRYAEWLGRTGKKRERRLYVYPMAADGAESSLPHIEELTVALDLSRAGAKEVRTGMTGVLEKDAIVVRAQDLVPRADLAVELFDEGLLATAVGYTAPHVVDLETLAPADRDDAMRRAKNEADYVVVPVSGSDVPEVTPGIDLAIVVDTSAATERSTLAIARAETAALLAHLGKDDRAVVWAGDDGLRPVVAGRAALGPVDEAMRRDVLTNLGSIDRGGATDLGAVLAKAANALDPARRGAVVYIGDGRPTVGELDLTDLRARLAKLPHPVRLFGLGVGDSADMGILKGLARGAFAERVGDANGAARAALRLLEFAERPAMLGTAIDLGPSVERIYPRDIGAIVSDESVVVVGRVNAGGLPKELTVGPGGGGQRRPLTIVPIDDHGDLGRRWAGGQLDQMLDEGTGRAAMVDLGSRHGIITPFTSLYVPTKNEMTPDEVAELERRKLMTVHNRLDVDGQQQASGELGYGRKADEEAPMASSAAADNKEGGTGVRAKGEEGSMGNPGSRPTGARFGVQGPTDAPAFAPELAKKEAAQFGMIGLLSPSAPGGAARAAPPPPSEDMAKLTEKLASAQEAQVQAGAVAKAPVRAIGSSAGGKPAAREARGDQLAGLDSRAPSTTTMNAKPSPAPSAAPALAPRNADDKEANASENAMRDTTLRLAGDPFSATFAGGESPYFSGGGLGLSGIGEGGGGRGDAGGLQGVASAHATRTVEADGKAAKGNATAAEAKTKAKEREVKLEVTLQASDVPHFAIACSGAAAVPFEERIGLWRERLAKVTGNVSGVAAVYQRALRGCEAPAWRERAMLLAMMLDAMPSVTGRVSLWRAMSRELGAADALYRGILSRVRTPGEVRELHAALGLRSIDPGVLAKMLADAKTPSARAKKLRELVSVWPDDFTLALKLEDALEDANDDGGARELGRTLRARPDADARLRTALGELYLRLAKRGAAADKEQSEKDLVEARRAFGEIVEFAPDDPVARRRLGDLLRAHGWYAEATRQYETLAKLAPDDASVPFLRAATAEGLGQLEEAVKWAEKGGAAGSPDAEQGPAGTARAFAATYLAWGRLAAEEAGRKEEAETLAARLVHVLAPDRAILAPKGTRVSLVWSHPELHPTLWSNALGAPMPAPEGDVTLGIALAMMPARSDAFVEVRVEPDELEHAARLGATAILTVVFGETSDHEKIVRRVVSFAAGGPAVQRFALTGGEVRP